MPSLKAIRKRIGSVRSTQKITKAMKMVAAANLHRAQQAIMATRPYAYRIDGLIKGLCNCTEDDPHPLMVARPDVRKVGLLVITSDKGLCGGFNANILRAVDRQIALFQGAQVELALVGRKSIENYRNKPRYHVNVTFPETYNHNLYEEADVIADLLVHRFEKSDWDEVWVVYNEFKSVISQNLRAERLIPIQPDENAETIERHDYTFEPGQRAILDELVPENVTTQVYRCLLESQAAEFGARMSAMEGATRAAGEMIDRLSLTYNRARQAAITTELMEIIGGAEALKG